MDRAAKELALAGLIGLVFGLGLGVAANVSGVVLGMYGLVLGALTGAALLGWRRRGRSRD